MDGGVTMPYKYSVYKRRENMVYVTFAQPCGPTLSELIQSLQVIDNEYKDQDVVSLSLDGRDGIYITLEERERFK